MLQQDQARRLRARDRRDPYGARIRRAGLRRGRPHDRLAGQRASTRRASTRRPASVLVEIDPRYFRPTEVDLLLGDPTKARQQLGWRHDDQLRRAGREMVEHDLASAQATSAARAATDAAVIAPSCSLAGKRVWVAGHRGMVGLGARAAARHARAATILDRGPRRASICARQAEVEALDRRRAARRGLPGRGHGRRHPRQRHAARPSSSTTTSRSRPTSSQRAHRSRRREAALPRLVLHLSEARAAADDRGRAADRPARADQRVVRDRQDRRHQAVPGLSPAIRRATSSRPMPTNLYGPGDNFDLAAQPRRCRR